MDKGYIENGFIVDVSNARKTSDIIYELSTILDLPEAQSKKVCIKSHPREKTDYKSIFPFAEFIPSYIPFELLVLMSKHNIKSAITVNSTAIYSLDKSVEKVILGMGYLQKYRNE